MSKSLLALVTLLAICPVALACLCPPDMDTWLRQADKVLVVRVDSVASEYEDMISGNTCDTDQPPCFAHQVATITTVHSIKGSGRALPRVSSGYGGGDCGIPLIAGGYYVIFMQGSGHRVGICNSAGPYIKLPHDSGMFPKQIDTFVKSLELAAKKSNAHIAPPPAPQFGLDLRM